MARRTEQKLYQALIDSEFSFVMRGERSIEEVYSSVFAEHPHLCDNTYYCSENCKSGNDQPEWKHTVRNALQGMKRLKRHISFTGQRGYWEFR